MFVIVWMIASERAVSDGERSLDRPEFSFPSPTRARDTKSSRERLWSAPSISELPLWAADTRPADPVANFPVSTTVGDLAHPAGDVPVQSQLV